MCLKWKRNPTDKRFKIWSSFLCLSRPPIFFWGTSYVAYDLKLCQSLLSRPKYGRCLRQGCGWSRTELQVGALSCREHRGHQKHLWQSGNRNFLSPVNCKIFKNKKFHFSFIVFILGKLWWCLLFHMFGLWMLSSYSNFRNRFQPLAGNITAYMGVTPAAFDRKSASKPGLREFTIWTNSRVTAKFLLR